MRRIAFVGVLVLLAVMLDAAVPAFAERTPSPSPVATSYTLALAADRQSAERNETITYWIWLNVTDGGSLQLVSVNFTVDPDLILVGTAITIPFSCGTSSSNATFAGWQCSFLSSGRSYRFTVPVLVDANATRGRPRTATAEAVELGGGPATPRIAQVPVWIVIGLLALQVVADSSSPPVLGSNITFVVNVTNVIATDVDPLDVQNLTAYNVRIAIGISPLLEVGSATPRLVVRSYMKPSENVNVTFTGIVRNATVGDRIWVNATVLYEDIANRSIGPKFDEQLLTVQAPPPLRTDFTSVVAVLAFALLAILAAVLIAPVLGERNQTIEEVFLVHRSGVLIQHLSRGPGLRKDDDLVASMFVAIQEFVRDSFHTKATLDELSFAGRKAAVLRGRHVVLAALVSRGNPRYLFPQMRAVERALESAHGPALVDWDGRVAGLDQAGPILESFLAGGFRRMQGWGR